MVSATLRRAIFGVTFMLLGSACASILGDFELKTDVCTAGQNDCCPDAAVDKCTTGDQSCPKDCAGTDGCDPRVGCLEALESSDIGALCPDSPALDAFVALKKCICRSACQSECQSTLCRGTLPVSRECETCARRSSACDDEYFECDDE